jgi:hypothetical protein
VGRSRGFIDWQPRAESRALLSQVEAVLDEYRAYLPLTCRQVFYRLVGAHRYEKSENAYGRMLGVLSNARRSRLLPFNAIRDGQTNITHPWVDDWKLASASDSDDEHDERFTDDLRLSLEVAHADHADFWDRARREYDAFWDNFWIDQAAKAREVVTFSRLDAQPRRIEVWVEAAGMVPLIKRAVSLSLDASQTARGAASVYSSGGFDSLTEKHLAAQRIAQRDVPTVVLHVGDHDPSGVTLYEAAREDVEAFTSEFGGEVEFSRLAVTPAQAAEYDLPSAPPKPSDKRSAWSGDETWQVEAFPPDVLVEVVREGVTRQFDEDAEQELVERERALRERLVTTVQEKRTEWEEDLER